MVYEWTCPYCGGKAYSAGAYRGEERTKCIYCAEEYKNPYYEPSPDKITTRRDG